MKNLIKNAINIASKTAKQAQENCAAISGQLPKAQWPINPGGVSC